MLEKFLHIFHGENLEFWLARDTTSGKLLATVGASIMTATPQNGGIGFFEMDSSAKGEDAAQKLIAAAEAWLLARNVHDVFAPININTWFPYRFRFDHEPQSFAWEPNHPPSYSMAFQKRGFAVDATYVTICNSDLAELARKCRADYERALDAGFTFRAFDRDKFLSSEVEILHRLSMGAFSNNFLFEPISLGNFRELYVPVASKYDLSHSYLAFSSTGQAVGFWISFMEQGYLIFKSIAVLPEFRGQGISNALCFKSSDSALATGVDQFVSALMHQTNISQGFSRKTDILWEHHYGLMKKNIKPQTYEVGQ